MCVALTAKCARIAISTRPLRWLAQLYERLPHRPIAVVANGAAVYDPESDEVPDPWGGPEAGYEETVRIVRAAARGLVAEIVESLQTLNAAEIRLDAPIGDQDDAVFGDFVAGDDPSAAIEQGGRLRHRFHDRRCEAVPLSARAAESAQLFIVRPWA